MIQCSNFALIKKLIVFPSISAEKNIRIGPENNANHATKAKGLISLLKGLTSTCPSAQVAEPSMVRLIPIILPSKFGDPVRI